MRATYYFTNYCGICHEIMQSVIDPAMARGAPIELVNCMSEPDRAIDASIDKVPTLIIYVKDTERLRYHGTAITKELVAELLETP